MIMSTAGSVDRTESRSQLIRNRNLQEIERDFRRGNKSSSSSFPLDGNCLLADSRPRQLVKKTSATMTCIFFCFVFNVEYANKEI